MSLGDFKILKVLSEGAYGCVYKVHKIQENQKYAMKVIRRQGLMKKEEKLHQWSALAGFVANQENSEIKEAFFEKNDLNFIMEYSENGEFKFNSFSYLLLVPFRKF